MQKKTTSIKIVLSFDERKRIADFLVLLIKVDKQISNIRCQAALTTFKAKLERIRSKNKSTKKSAPRKNRKTKLKLKSNQGSQTSEPIFFNQIFF